MENPSDVNGCSASIYGEKLHEPGGEPMSPEYGKYLGSNERSREQWLKHTHELIDQYQPELIWFDWTVGKYPFQSTFYQFLAYYYNNAIDWKKEVVVNTKLGYGDNIQVLDIERGKSDRIRKFPWQTDTSIGKKSWSYCTNEVNKTPDQIIDDLVDIVSKNGNLLLNIGPKADGTITPEQQYVLSEIGKWLKVNGEAIYGSRPWIKSGEGENKGSAGYMTDGEATKYSASDIRFTTKGKMLYAICLDRPGAKINVKSLASTFGIVVRNVEILGSTTRVSWKQTNDGLLVDFPKIHFGNYAYTLKISTVSK
jgi:alpha-L-fucosidase